MTTYICVIYCFSMGTFPRLFVTFIANQICSMLFLWFQRCRYKGSLFFMYVYSNLITQVQFFFSVYTFYLLRRREIDLNWGEGKGSLSLFRLSLCWVATKLFDRRWAWPCQFRSSPKDPYTAFDPFSRLYDGRPSRGIFLFVYRKYEKKKDLKNGIRVCLIYFRITNFQLGNSWFHSWLRKGLINNSSCKTESRNLFIDTNIPSRIARNVLIFVSMGCRVGLCIDENTFFCGSSSNCPWKFISNDNTNEFLEIWTTNCNTDTNDSTFKKPAPREKPAQRHKCLQNFSFPFVISPHIDKDSTQK